MSAGVPSGQAQAAAGQSGAPTATATSQQPASATTRADDAPNVERAGSGESASSLSIAKAALTRSESMCNTDLDDDDWELLSNSDIISVDDLLVSHTTVARPSVGRLHNDGDARSE